MLHLYQDALSRIDTLTSQVTQDRKEMTVLRRQVNKLEMAETDLMHNTTMSSQRCVALESEAQQQLAAMARVRDQLASMTAAKVDADKQIVALTASLLQRQEEVL